MNIVAAVAAILAPAAAFQFVLRRCALPGSEHASASERVGTSIALSLGFSSVVFFLARLMSLP